MCYNLTHWYEIYQNIDLGKVASKQNSKLLNKLNKITANCDNFSIIY